MDGGGGGGVGGGAGGWVGGWGRGEAGGSTFSKYFRLESTTLEQIHSMIYISRIVKMSRIASGTDCPF